MWERRAILSWAQEGKFGLMPLDVCKRTDGGHYFRVECGRMCVHVRLVEIFKYFHVHEPFLCSSSLPAACLDVAGSWLILPGK